MSKSQTEVLIREYKKVYFDANGTHVDVTYERGWFRVASSGFKYRRQGIEALRDELRRRAAVIAEEQTGAK